jgi:hypothetical protein
MPHARSDVSDAWRGLGKLKGYKKLKDAKKKENNRDLMGWDGIRDLDDRVRLDGSVSPRA